MLFLAFFAVVAALGFLGYGVVTSWEQRRSRRQLPPRPGPGGHAPEGERHGGTGHDPVPPGPRNDQARADLRAHKSRQHIAAPADPASEQVTGVCAQVSAGQVDAAVDAARRVPLAVIAQTPDALEQFSFRSEVGNSVILRQPAGVVAAFNPRAPFGGYKQSGVGREIGDFGISDVLEIKAVQL